MVLEKMIDELYGAFEESYSKRNPCKFRNRISWISMPGLGEGTNRKQNDYL